MTLKKYWQELKEHDWYYPMSDDMKAYRAGQTNQTRLLKIAALSPAHDALYDQFDSHYRAIVRCDLTVPALPEEPVDEEKIEEEGVS